MRMVSSIHSYRPKGQGSDSHCGLQIYRTDQADIIVLSDLQSNKGLSVTKCAEQLINETLSQYEHYFQRLDRLIVIVHYARTLGYRHDSLEEILDQVVFLMNLNQRSIKQVSWRRLTEPQVEKFIGEKWTGFEET